MEPIKQSGGVVWVAEAADWVNNSSGHLNIGITLKGIRARGERGQRFLLGQMYGVVGTGMIMAEHVFQGLKRDMLVREDEQAAVKKLAVTWHARRDAKLVGDRHNCRLQYFDAPEGCVFAVYVSPNEMLEDFPDIYGWAEHWAWIAAAPDLPGAPVDWQTRYDSLIWSKI